MEPPQRLADIDPGQRRRALARSGAIVLFAFIMILGAFYALPFDHFSSERSVLRLSAVVALVIAVFVWQIRRIAVAELPELRAAEALGIVISVFLVGFSIVYLSMYNANVHSFNQRLDHSKALYFTISVFSTVGFGDIVAKTDTARLVVSAQMLLDLAIIGVVVRMIFTAARSRISPGENGERDSRPAPAE
jgi:lysylphosphatidylglycerol synthetase-like protein (DUF2156 family)